jgi:hypothetical protein
LNFYYVAIHFFEVLTTLLLAKIHLINLQILHLNPSVKIIPTTST